MASTFLALAVLARLTAFESTGLPSTSKRSPSTGTNYQCHEDRCEKLHDDVDLADGSKWVNEVLFWGNGSCAAGSRHGSDSDYTYSTDLIALAKRLSGATGDGVALRG